MFSANVALQEKCTPESLREEMGGFDETFTSLDQAKPKTFVEKLMLGEVDFDGSDEEDD